MEGTKQLILSVQKALTLLDVIIEQGDISMNEAAKMLDLNRSSAYRLLETLESMEYASKNKENFRYECGIKLEAYYLKRLNAVEIYSIARPVLQTLAAETSQAVHLCELSSRGMLFIGQEFGPEVIRISKETFTAEPVYCTATGKAVLAFLQEKLRNRIMDGTKFEKHTQNTVTDASVLRVELESVRSLGYATDNGELHEWVSCIAAPVFDRGQYPVVSIGLSVPSQFLDHNGIEVYADKVLSSAAELTAILQKQKI